MVSKYFREDESEHAVTARVIAMHADKFLNQRIATNQRIESKQVRLKRLTTGD